MTTDKLIFDVNGQKMGWDEFHKAFPDLIITFSKEQPNGARDEYFDQLIDKAAEWHECPDETLPIAQGLKEDILSITYDANVALQKRVEELEAALKWSNDRMQESVYWIEKDVNDVRSVDTVAHIDLQIEENNRLLNKQS